MESYIKNNKNYNMNINIIVSVSENWAIGKDNKLLWKLSSDLKRFKKLTSGNPIIMGQRTYESLPNGPLPNRTNIVLTDNKDFFAPNVTPAYNIFEAIERAKLMCGKECEIFIIGGGMVYKAFLEYADYIYLTTVHTTIDGDTYFPEIKDDNTWLLESEEYHKKNEKNEYDYTYKLYKRKR